MRPLRVGWVGLGAMGLPMSSRLAGAGHDVRVCEHRNAGAIDEVRRAGATAYPTPRELAEGAELVITMVRDEAQTDDVVRGGNGVLAGLAPDAVLVVMSTLSARFCLELATDAAQRGVEVVDAPVSGGTRAAAAGSLSIMVGGATAVVERCRPVLATLGDQIFHLGGVGAGQQAKIVNNAIKAGILALTTEGLALGAGAGLELDVLLAALRAGSADSHVLEEWEYYYRFKLDDRVGGPHEILHKDLTFAVELAEELGVDAPLIRGTAAVDLSRPVPERSAV